MKKTTNHNLHVPPDGTKDWGTLLNQNFAQLDTVTEVRDAESNKTDYQPKTGAKYEATDTGAIYYGSGTTWVLANRTIERLRTKSESITDRNQVFALGPNGNYSEGYSSSDYGSKREAITAALSDLKNSGGGALVLGPTPSDDSITIPSSFSGWSVGSNVSIYGQGRNATDIYIEGDMSNPLFDFEGTNSSRNFVIDVRDFSVTADPDSSPTVPTVFDFSYCSSVTTHNIRVNNVRGTALNLDHSWDTVHIAPKITNCGDDRNSNPAISLKSSGSVGSGDEQNNCVMFGLHLERPLHRGITISGGSNRFTNCKLHGEDQQSSHPLVVLQNGGGRNLFNQVSFQSINNGGGLVINDCGDLHVSQCMFNHGAAPDYHVKINGGEEIRFRDTSFGGGSTDTGYGIAAIVADGGSDIVLEGVRLSGHNEGRNVIVSGVPLTVRDISVKNTTSDAIRLESGSSGTEVENVTASGIDGETIFCSAGIELHTDNVPSVSFGGNAVTGTIEDPKNIYATASSSVHLIYNSPTDLTSVPSRNNLTGWGYHDGTNGAEGLAELNEGSNDWVRISDGTTIT